MDSVILQLPLAMMLYGLALALFLFDRTHKATNGIITLISTAVAVVGTVYALLMGAPLTECATVLMVFMLLNMGVKE
jgi:hypothetical protein